MRRGAVCLQAAGLGWLMMRTPMPLAQTTSLFRLEYRFDESTGAQGGFFKRGDVSLGVPGLTASQHLLMMSIILAFDS